jgi:nucleotide-binding universal stress UspA family protein
MKSIHNILIATDFSAHSDHALIMGRNLQKKTNAKVTLVHISDVPPLWYWHIPNTEAKSVLDEFQKETNENLKAKIHDQMTKLDVKFDTKILYGDQYHSLHEAIKEEKADLLIMGHRGEKGLFQLGSFAKKMIASSSIPLIITNSSRPVDKVGCLIDLSKPNAKIIEMGGLFSQLFHAHLSFFSHIPDLSSKALMGLPFSVGIQMFSDEDKKEIIQHSENSIMAINNNIAREDIHISISPEDVSIALSDELEAFNIDLAVMAKHNRGPLEKLFIGSVSKGVIDQFKGSVLILPS